MRVGLFTIGWFAGLWMIDRAIAAASTLLLLGCLGFGIGLRLKQAYPWMRFISIGFLAGIGRMVLAQDPLPPNHISQLIGQELIISGRITEEPRWTAERQRIVVEAEQVLIGVQAQTTQGKVQIELPPEPSYRLGQTLLIQGIGDRPKSGDMFDYAEYLARRDIFMLLQKARVLEQQPEPQTFRSRLLHLKHQAQQVIVQTIPEPQAALLVGILLGIQSSVPQDVWNAFNRTGTSHILVISGWNISVIVVALLAMGKYLGWRLTLSTGVALGTIVVYVLLVGPSAAVVRAAVMGAIVACAAPLGRRSDAWTALAAACWLMTLINPHTLWDLGFQLSALATASLFAWGKPLQTRLEPWFERPWLRWMLEPLSATLAAQVWALPPILYHFGNLSLIAPIANILIGPAVPLAMAAGAVLVVLGLMGRALAFVALPLTWIALWWIIWVAEQLAAVSWAAVQVPIFSIWWIVGFYGVTIAGWAWHLHQQAQPEAHGLTTTLLTASTQRTPANKHNN